MRSGVRITIIFSGLLLASISLGGCSSEPVGDPWINSQQRELIDEELDRSPEVTAQLRDRLTRIQADR